VAHVRAKGSGFVVRWREGGFLSRPHSRFVQSREEAEALIADLAFRASARRIRSKIGGSVGSDDETRPDSVRWIARGGHGQTRTAPG
jgi:hypothetical protein